jgi:hypothetical protein
MTTNPPDLILRLANGSRLVDDEAYEMLLRLHEIGASTGAAAAPYETGTLGESLFLGGPSTASIVTPTRAVIGSNLPYFGAQEDALEHTARGVWWPPSEPIEAWVMRKGLADDQDVQTVAYWIRRKIATVGITPHHFMRAALGAVESAVPFEAESMAERVAERIEGAGSAVGGATRSIGARLGSFFGGLFGRKS